MDNKKIIALIIIILLIIVFITMISDTCNAELFSSDQETILPFKVQEFLNNDPSNNKVFDLLGYKFNMISDPSNITITNKSENYVIYNTDPSNNNSIMLVGHLDIKDLSQNINKCFVIFIINNIIVSKDASGVVEPSFVNYGFVLNNNDENLFEIKNNKILIKTLTNTGDKINVTGSSNISGSVNLVIGKDGLYANNTKPDNILLRYDYMANSLRPSYNINYNTVVNNITIHMVDLLKKKYS